MLFVFSFDVFECDNLLAVAIATKIESRLFEVREERKEELGAFAALSDLDWGGVIRKERAAYSISYRGVKCVKVTAK